MEYTKTHKVLDQVRREINRIYSQEDIYTTKGCGSAVIRMCDVSIGTHRTGDCTTIFTRSMKYRVCYSNTIDHTGSKPKTLDHLPKICVERMVKEFMQVFE